MEYTIYTAEGHYRMGLTCPTEKDRDLNMKEGDRFAEGDHPEASYLDADGVVRELPPAPGQGLRFDTLAGQWVDERGEEEREAHLAVLRQTAIAEINRMRGQARRQFITVTDGQDLVYMEKERAALEWMTEFEATGVEPTGMRFRAIEREVGPGLTGETAYQVAYIYLYKAQEWRYISPEIEHVAILHINRAEVETDELVLADLPYTFKANLDETIAQVLTLVANGGSE